MYKEGSTLAYIRFHNNGYDYSSSETTILFSADNTHDYLFKYIEKDLTDLNKLFETYIAQIMDTSTFTLVENQNSQNSDTYIIKIIEILKTLHPFYALNYKKIIIKEIGTYFNHLLVYASFRTNRTLLDKAADAEWYYKRLNCLMPSLLATKNNYPDGLHPDDFFHKFKQWIDKHDYYTDEGETFVLNVPKQMPKGFSEEITTQKNVYDMLFFILDISAQGLEKITIPQRMWLYSNIFNMGDNYSDLKVVQHIRFYSSSLSADNNNHIQEYSCKKNFDKLFKPLNALTNLNVGRNGIPKDLIECFNSAIDYAKCAVSVNLYEEYEINSLRELLYLEIISMIRAGTMIRKCKNCGKYFVVKNRKTAYCDRINESGLYCSAVGSKQSFQRKMDNEEELKIYNRAYKTHHARLRNKKMNSHEFETWTHEAKDRLEKVRAGELDIAAFKEWLKK